ncbi:Hypothetical predicted protein [Paramuricea clavata]|uniref:Uncharacterized protein n=1 Tax=Paramuricea clavata TaxID=317549 RepID=A0A6S7FZS3_PARCT|nr:Hypothetical predicted protein [Paramuricea clavata]
MDGELIKVFYSENVFYRFYYKKYLIAEVMLPDGSVLRSTGPTHIYFKHWVYDLKSESVKENVYSAKAPPLNDRTSPTAKILNTVCRYLKYLSICWKRQTVTLGCCWKNENDPQLLDAERKLEFSTYIRDHGSFKIYSNGRVRIVFCDGAVMDFNYPNEEKCKIRSRDDENFYNGSSCEKHKTALVDDTSFRLILPSGISLKASFDSPAGPYNRYVQIALDFIKWKQNHVEKEMQLDYEYTNHVYEELEKLRRFTASDSNNKEHYIVPCVETHQESDGLKIGANEISNTLSREAHLVMSPLSQIKNVEGYLNDTRKAVDEIDTILQNCKRQLEKR